MPGNDVEIVVGARDSSAPALDGLRARLKEVRDAAKNAGGNVQLSTDYGRAQADLLIARLAEVKKKVADLAGAKVRMDTSEFRRQADLINLRMERLSKLIARPRIDMEGVAKALADMAGIDAAVGRVNAQNKRVGFFTRTSTWGGLGKTLMGLIPGLGGAATGVAGAGAAGTAAGGAGPAAAAFANPWVAGGLTATSVAAAPILAQLAGTGLVGGLGTGLLGFGVMGAAKLRPVKEQFKDLTATINRSMREIGRPLAPALDAIMRAFGKTMRILTPAFTTAMKVMAGPLKTFGDALAKAFAQPSVQHAIVAIAKAFGGMLKQLGPAIGPAIGAIATGITAVAKAIGKNPKMFAQLIEGLAKMVEGVLIAIAWLTNLANYIERHFGPAMHRVAVIFDGVRHEIAHIWDMIWNNTIGRLERGFHDERVIFDNIRHHISNTFDGIRHDIAHWWDMAWNNTIGRAERGIHDVRVGFDNMRHSIAAKFDQIRHDIAHWWDMAWNNTIGRLVRGIRDVRTGFDNLRHSIAAKYDQIRHDIAHVWDVIWNNTVGRVKRGAADVVKGIRNLWNDIWNQIRHWPQWFWNLGKNAIQGLWNGMKWVWNKVTGWIKSLAGWVKGHKGPVSFDKNLLFDNGKALMQGLHLGMLAGFGGISGFVQGLASTIGGLISTGISSLFRGGGAGGAGVARWRGTVLRALAMEGLPATLAGRVLYQMQTESSGNPNAINLTDINARMGDPSRGLLQTIMSTFLAYHWPGTSWDIYNPLANVAAAINYARHVYGPMLMSGGMGMGSGHGYWMGTSSALPGMALVGERGPELVRFRGGEQVAPLGRGRPQTIVLEICSTGHSDFDRFMVSWLQRAVRTRGGGDVQVAFGGRS
jgi:SLT domain-containing protein